MGFNQCWSISRLDPLHLLIYINDLPEGLFSDIKLVDDTSLLAVVFGEQKSTTDINNDLKMISEWPDHQKVSLDPSKQA